MGKQTTIAIAALLFALPAGAQIYRCQAEGVTVFSDRPCGPEPGLFIDSARISFIAPDENLPALAEAAQAYVRERRERLARQRQRQTVPSHQPPPTHFVTRTVVLPWLPAAIPKDHHSPGHDTHVHNGEPPVIAGNDRYSPLNGPILGTRRDIRYPDPPGRRRQHGRNE